MPSALRDVPWRWAHVAACFVPLVILSLVTHHLGPLSFVYSASGLWMLVTLLAEAWMVACPLRAAGGPMPLPSFRIVATEGLIGLLSLPAVMIAAAVMMSFIPPDTQDSAVHPLETIAHARQPHQVVTLVFVAVIAAPLGEELCFRGLLYNALRRRVDFLPAALLQAIVFAIYHPYGAQGRMGVATMGFAFTLLSEWRKTLITPIALHSSINACTMATVFQ